MKVIMESVKSTSIAQTNHYYRQKSAINVAKFSWGIAPWSATATINSFPTPQTAQPEEPSQRSTVKSSPSAFKLHFLCYSLPSDTIDAIYHLKQRQINLWQQQKLAQPRPISKTKHLKKQAPCTQKKIKTSRTPLKEEIFSRSTLYYVCPESPLLTRPSPPVFIKYRWWPLCPGKPSMPSIQWHSCWKKWRSHKSMLP